MNHKTPVKRVSVTVSVAGSARPGQSMLLWILLCVLAGLAVLLINQAVMGRAAINSSSPSSAHLQSDPVFTQIDGSFSHTCGVTEAGGMMCWGRNYSGELGDGTTTYSSIPVAVSIVSGTVDRVATGEGFTCVLLTTGPLQCWGANEFGQLGNGTTDPYLTPTAVSGLSSGVQGVAAGDAFVCALTSAGDVFCWGKNAEGQLGDGTTTDRTTPVMVSNLPNPVMALAVGTAHACALTNQDAVYCWGRNAERQLGNNATTNRSMPVLASGLPSGAAELAAGFGHTCVRTAAGTVACWGNNGSGELGNGGTTDSGVPVTVLGLSNALEIRAGQFFTCVRTATDGAQCWGGNWDGQLGNGDRDDRTSPTTVSGLGSGVIALGTGTDHGCAARAGGGMTCWGGNWDGQLGNGVTLLHKTAVAVTGITATVAQVAAGAWHNCLMTSRGGVQCWGSNWLGQVGDGSRDDRGTATNVMGMPSGATILAAGDRHTCAVQNGLLCWGGNEEGQVGIGSATELQAKPIAVLNQPTNVTGLVLGERHSCALAGGGVFCWGANDAGQLGVGQQTPRNLTPTAVPGLGSGVAAIAAGELFTCALLAVGDVQCWGVNEAGQLGDGSYTQQFTPVAVNGLPTGVTALAAGVEHACVLTGDGRVYCWGANWAGQLGDGTEDDRSAPTAVVGLSRSALAISAGQYHTCARLDGGGLQCWGYNATGQLGDDTLANRRTPTTVVGLTGNVQQVAAGGEHTCALVVLSGLFCWGLDTSGQIGVNRAIIHENPQVVQFATAPTPTPTLADTPTVPADTPTTAPTFTATSDLPTPPTSTPIRAATATPKNELTATPTLTVEGSPTPDARTVYLPYASNSLNLQWRKWGEGPGVASALARNDEQIFVGDRRTFVQKGGLYSGPLGNCSTPVPWERLESVNAGILSVDFSDDLGLAAAFENHLFAYSAQQNQWTQTGSELSEVYTVAFAGEVGYAGAGDRVYQRGSSVAPWQELFQASANINVIRREGTSLWVGTEGAGVQEHPLGSTVLIPRTNGLANVESQKVWDIYLQDDINFIATYDGVYWSDSQVNWQRMGSNLIGVQTRSLEIFGEHLYVGAVGAGVWRIPIGDLEGVWQPVTSGEPSSASWTVRDLLAVDAPCAGLLAATDEGVWLFKE
ncbi:MAG: hypothetical protein R3A44_42175 [Caldilineaceae bacterium]